MQRPSLTELQLKHIEKYEPYPFTNRLSDYSKGSNRNKVRIDNGERVYGQLHIEREIIYGGYEQEGERDRQYVVNISLLNDKMLDMEYSAIEEDNWSLFFYEFTGEATFSGLEYTKKSLRRVETASEYIASGIVDGAFYSFRIIELDENNEYSSIREISERYKNYFVFYGEVIFSASPILSHRVAIVIEDDSLDRTDEDAYKKMQAIYRHWDNVTKDKYKKAGMLEYDRVNIVAELDKIFDATVNADKVYIYNVGQANCCYCDLDTKKIFFDIGVTRNETDLNTCLIQQAVYEISTLSPDAVILSHWDLDHILGVCYNRECLDNKIWIAPDFEKLYRKPTLSIKRICNYLLRMGKSKILLVDTSAVDKKLFESSNKSVTIYLGTIKASGGVNRMNNGGLIMKLENKKNNGKNILMPGDCDNIVIPSEAVADEYDNVLVSHHGAVMSAPTVKGKTTVKCNAYISVGEHMGNCNPDPNIKEKYKKCRFVKLKKTKNLRIKNKYIVDL